MPCDAIDEKQVEAAARVPKSGQVEARLATGTLSAAPP